MVQCKVMKQLDYIEQRKFDDEDILADIEFLKEKMEASLQDLRYVDTRPSRQISNEMCRIIKQLNLKNLPRKLKGIDGILYMN